MVSAPSLGRDDMLCIRSFVFLRCLQVDIQELLNRIPQIGDADDLEGDFAERQRERKRLVGTVNGERIFFCFVKQWNMI